MPYAKRLAVEDKRDSAARGATLAGIALALIGAERLSPAGRRVAELVFPVDGKPSFADGPYFSVSHSDDRVACALSPTHDVGLDVEGIADDATAQRGEQLRRWTAIEAALKAAALGMRRAREVHLEPDLSAAEVGGVRYSLRRIELARDCVCHLATRQPPQHVTVEEVDLASGEISALLERSLGRCAQLE